MISLSSLCFYWCQTINKLHGQLNKSISFIVVHCIITLARTCLMNPFTQHRGQSRRRWSRHSPGQHSTWTLELNLLTAAVVHSCPYPLSCQQSFDTVASASESRRGNLLDTPNGFTPQTELPRPERDMSTRISRRHIIIHFISISLMNAAKYHLPKSVISQWNSSGESQIEFSPLPPAMVLGSENRSSLKRET